MQIWKVLQKMLETFNELRAEGGFWFWFIAVINVIIAIVILWGTIAQLKDGLWKALNLLGKLIIIIETVLRCALIPTITMFFVCADKLEKTAADLFNNRYYIEIIIVAVINFLLQCLYIKLSENNNVGARDSEAEEEVANDVMKSLLKCIFLVIISLLFLFTNLENGLVNFGFTIFKKKIGAWIYGAYAAWSVGVIIGVFITVVRVLSNLPLLSLTKRNA